MTFQRSFCNRHLIEDFIKIGFSSGSGIFMDNTFAGHFIQNTDGSRQLALGGTLIPAAHRFGEFFQLSFHPGLFRHIALTAHFGNEYAFFGGFNISHGFTSYLNFKIVPRLEIKINANFLFHSADPQNQKRQPDA